MTSPHAPADDLLARLRAGDREAFRQLIDRHQAKVLNICYRFVHSREDAEDLTQSTFVKVFQSIRTFRGDSTLATWIHRIAVAQSLDFVRKRDRQKRGGKLKRLLGLEDRLETIAAPSGDQPDAALERQERRQVLAAALARIPKSQRTAFILAKVNDLSHKEIAEIMKVTPGAVESLIHRARESLQRHLRGYYADSPQDRPANRV